MTIIMYDLAAAEPERRPSPFCWRTRMALAHKGLEVETIPWQRTEKDKLPKPNEGRVPVIVDGDRVVHDSPLIADYLEERYADRPSLYGGEVGRALTRFVENWTGTVIHPGAVRLTALDGLRHLGLEEQAYVRRAREVQFGTTVEEAVKDRESRLPVFRASLDPLRRTLERQEFVAGNAPAYADYVVFGAFQWARSISDFELLATDDPVRAWRSRMLDLFGGLARHAPGYGG